MTRPPAHARRAPTRRRSPRQHPAHGRPATANPAPVCTRLRSSRHARRLAFPSGAAKPLLCMALAFALALSPWEPVLLTDNGPGLGTPPAAAQETPTQAPGEECAGTEQRDADVGATGVVCGTPSPCPSDPADTRPWAPDPADPSRCAVTMPACPRSPLQEAGQREHYMEPSSEYAEFCEHSVLSSENPSLFDICDRGFVWPLERNFTVKKSGTTCTAILPSRCPSGMHRLVPSAGNSNCRQYERRHWTCTPETARRLNQFNTCFVGRPASEASVSHPACSRGAPHFAVSDCSNYVGRDYMQAPGAFLCSRYDIGTSPNSAALQDVAENAHWCAYGRSWLELRCHGNTRTSTSACQDLDSESVRCIKRASSGGGCGAVAKTIRCQALRASLRDGGEAQLAEDIQREGCTPCVILPFEPVPRRSGSRARDGDACPPEFSRDPTPHLDGNLRKALEMRVSVNRNTLQLSECIEVLRGALLEDHPSCQNAVARQEAFCDDPSVISLEWTTALGSGALVNSPLIVNLAGSAMENTAYGYFRVTGGRLDRTSIQAMKYSGTPQTLVSQWPSTRNPYKRPRTNKDDYVAETIKEAGGACYAQTLPLPRLIVEELWPDTDYDEIVRLFGEVALRRWVSWTDEQKQSSTEARGFVYVDDSATEEAKDAARRIRMQSLREQEDCNVARDSGQWWCRWVPQRAGYYRLTGELVWNLKRWLRNREWISRSEFDSANTWLEDNVSVSDGMCETTRDAERVTDADCIWEDLQSWGVMRPEHAGFMPDFRGLVDLPEGSDDPENKEAGELLLLDREADIHRCPSQDVRVQCPTNPYNFYYAYETTAPIGIIVQEARVVTRRAGTP